MLILILDQLPIPDLIHLLTTNPQLKERFYPIFADKIEDYQFKLEALKYARPYYNQNIQREIMENKFYLSDLILLDKPLSDFMGLENIPKYSGQTLYSISLLYLWWDSYINIVLNQSADFEQSVTLDQNMTSLINTTPPISMTLSDFIGNLIRTHTQLYNEPIDYEAESRLIQEYRELSDMLMQRYANIHARQTTH